MFIRFIREILPNVQRDVQRDNEYFDLIQLNSHYYTFIYRDTCIESFFFKLD